jgi:hypothetical protein
MERKSREDLLETGNTKVIPRTMHLIKNEDDGLLLVLVEAVEHGLMNELLKNRLRGPEGVKSY